MPLLIESPAYDAWLIERTQQPPAQHKHIENRHYLRNAYGGALHCLLVSLAGS